MGSESCQKPRSPLCQLNRVAVPDVLLNVLETQALGNDCGAIRRHHQRLTTHRSATGEEKSLTVSLSIHSTGTRLFNLKLTRKFSVKADIISEHRPDVFVQRN